MFLAAPLALDSSWPSRVLLQRADNAAPGSAATRAKQLGQRAEGNRTCWKRGVRGNGEAPRLAQRREPCGVHRGDGAAHPRPGRPAAAPGKQRGFRFKTEETKVQCKQEKVSLRSPCAAFVRTPRHPQAPSATPCVFRFVYSS